MHELPLLQAKNPYDGTEILNPVTEEENEGSYDLVAPYKGDVSPLHSLERQAGLMFSSEHMLAILNNPHNLARFREFLVAEPPRSLPTLTYYLNARKALKAILYADSLVRLSVDVPTPGIETAREPVGPTINSALLDALTAEELPDLSHPRVSRSLARWWRNAYEEHFRIIFKGRPMRWQRYFV